MLAGSDRDRAANLVDYGNCVVVDHGGGYLSLYGHLGPARGATGDAVRAAQEVGCCAAPVDRTPPGATAQSVVMPSDSTS